MTKSNKKGHAGLIIFILILILAIGGGTGFYFYQRQQPRKAVEHFLDSMKKMDFDTMESLIREFDSWISEKSTCRSHKTCFFCVKFLVFIYCILLQCVVKYNKGGILHASYYIEI